MQSLFEIKSISIHLSFESISDDNKKEALLNGESRFDENKNKYILEASTNYIKISEKFPGSIFE